MRNSVSIRPARTAEANWCSSGERNGGLPRILGDLVTNVLLNYPSVGGYRLRSDAIGNKRLQLCRLR